VRGQLGSIGPTKSSSPVSVTGISNAVSISAGNSRTCALLITGSVQCWGYFGYLDPRNGSIPVEVPGFGSAISISAAGNYDVCVVLTNGAVQCSRAGVNDTPEIVPGIRDAKLLSVGATAAGMEARAFLVCAVLTDGRVQCWDRAHGAAQTFSGINNATSVSVGNSSIFQAADICMVLMTGEVECAAGSYPLRSMVPVNGIVGASSVSVGPNFLSAKRGSCAVLSSGGIQCWGDNTVGQLGVGNTSTSSNPVTVFGITGAKSVVLGASHTCAMLGTGAVQCWGDNTFGQLGTASTLSYTPLSVVGRNGYGLLNLLTSTGSAFASSVDRIFDWAEKNFPQFSNPKGAESLSILGFRYRAYGERYYLAVNEGEPHRLYYYDAVSMNTLLDVGLLADFLPFIAK
jgi:hypothetical protein